MEELTKKLPALLAKYKYVALVVLVGIGLMLLPTGSTQDTTAEPSAAVQAQDPAAQLEDILSRIDGVGKVQVLLTVARSQETVYAYDEDSADSAESGSLRRDLVIVSGSDRTESGLVCTVIGPEYQGAVVVCQGGDQDSVRLAVVEAVCAATGLPAHKVSVLKMK